MLVGPTFFINQKYNQRWTKLQLESGEAREKKTRGSQKVFNGKEDGKKYSGATDSSYLWG